MKLEQIQELQIARSQKKQVALATNLTSGESSILYPFDTNDKSQLVDAARRALIQDRPTEIETEDGPVFINIFNPPLRMLIVGAVHIAQKLSEMAASTGYDVTVIDPRSSFASEFRFPNVKMDTRWPDEALPEHAADRRTAIVTLTHDAKLDDPALEYALNSNAFYIGALGSTRTRAKRQERLEQKGFNVDQISRIHGPVGLDIGAQSPAEIAISIMAEVTQVLRKGKAA
ncbi:XdhC family protein [Sneathiella glossodoripedis]|uniref:XdhC family protein n=1 Tax=Sneathiella glossodoripedis TaxID=418853 RepID=UPI0004709A27|nr:XdhC family protein [Sneathiella glossodoripedis]